MFALLFSLGQDLIDALLLGAVGMTVVFTGLLLINWFIALLARLLRAAEKPAEAAPVPVPAQASPALGEVEPATVAVITAAAVAAVGRPVRVQRITFINHNTISAWAERGRVSIHGSHNVRRPL
jgi:Na+-transporting methylmalonyl-CoA/oxaloacetate decarboxylase gamma subunit